MDKFEWGILGFWLFMFLLNLVFWGLLIFVGIHFVAKWW